MPHGVDWARGPKRPLAILTVLLTLVGLVYFGVLIFTSVLAPYRFPIPYAVPIFDTPFVLAAVGVGYLCWERHRLRHDRRSLALGGALGLAGLLGIAHILAQPDYPGIAGVDPGVAPYFFFSSYLAGFVGLALAMCFTHQGLSLTDRARWWIVAAVFGLGLLLVVGVMAIRLLLPPLVMKPGRLTPFAIWVAAISSALVSVEGLWRGRKALFGSERDWFTDFILLALFVWLLGFAGFLIFPFRYSVAWYIAGLARPVGVGVILVGLMREQVALYREIIAKNVELATREQLARAEAAASEHRFAALVEDLDAIVWEADENWRFSFVSRRAEGILGYRVARWLSEVDFLECHIHPDDRERTVASFREAVSAGRSCDFEYRAIAADARPVWLRAMVHAVRDGSGRVRKVRGLMIDVSERRLLEEQLRQAQKMEAVGSLAGGVAHDFNNLLTVIMGQTGLLRLHFEGKGLPDQDVDIIEESARWGAELTRQLVAFSRKQVLQLKILDVTGVVRDMSAMLRRVIGEHIQLVTVFEPTPWHVKADPGQLEQMIVNLAVNARDAMPTHGRLTVETANVELDGAYQRQHPDVPAGQYVMLAVSDTGCGMDVETQARIFEPFFTTKERGKGTGLGLSTVYGIVKQSGGTIWVYSEVGRGSTFKIYLPRVTDASLEVEPKQCGVPAARGCETILVAEDDDRVRAIVLRALRHGGYTVLEARDGHDALALAARHSGQIHLLVTDMIMPSMSGRELAERLTTIRPDTKVLFVSGYTDDALGYPFTFGREMSFLQKPFTFAMLNQKVRDLLSSQLVSAATANS